tara:strand:+ start:5133 stop:5600 length:468 start_codon:yes stop_codon:yes gene_type:complete
MKAINIDGTIKTYNSIPKTWGNILGVQYLNDSSLEELGFYNVVKPTTKQSQKLGSIEWDADNKVFTFPIQNKTYSQSVAELKTQKISNLKHNYGYELAKTDWIIIRDCELGNTTNSSILSSRATLRNECASKEAEINALSTKASIVDYQISSLGV